MLHACQCTSSGNHSHFPKKPYFIDFLAFLLNKKSIKSNYFLENDVLAFFLINDKPP